MESDNVTYRFSFDARQGANPVDSEFGVKIRIWAREYWWENQTLIQSSMSLKIGILISSIL